MLKKVSGLMLATTLVMGSAAGAAFAAPKATVAPVKTATQTYTLKVDGKEIVFKVAPAVEDKTILVPASELLEAMGGTAAWDSMTKSVLLAKDKTSVRLYADSSTGYKAGKKIKAPAKSKAVTGAILVPMTFVVQELGGKITWDGKTSTFTVTMPQVKK
ncbi:copper amine oxidase N-terminal domain-containing protein [Brevibacillus fluminis]|uniref:Copper amine oxidase N-terminal domain-containing protein n=1 Tax=Brevibacillus fluminis TaxID=511487 RepID=A0A3M8DJ47_9BACL|nr:copper amine oxidase N-terminal domain-containing protein [Brevibacillus fluminis]RNB87619.1 copper amine oxidase N-terminal domain-containing protein [Brevibacillus fluminis]